MGLLVAQQYSCLNVLVQIFYRAYFNFHSHPRFAIAINRNVGIFVSLFSFIIYSLGSWLFPAIYFQRRNTAEVANALSISSSFFNSA